MKKAKTRDKPYQFRATTGNKLNTSLSSWELLTSKTSEFTVLPDYSHKNVITTIFVIIPIYFSNIISKEKEREPDGWIGGYRYTDDSYYLK